MRTREFGLEHEQHSSQQRGSMRRQIGAIVLVVVALFVGQIWATIIFSHSTRSR